MIDASVALTLAAGFFLIIVFMALTRKPREITRDEKNRAPSDPSWHTPHPVTTLTKYEVQLLQTSWEKVNFTQKESGILLFKNFFTDFPKSVQLFRDFKDKPLEQILKMGQLRAHAVTVMRALTSVIENLDDYEVVVDILKKQGYNHYSRGVVPQDFLNLNVSVLKTLKMALGSDFTGDRAKAWEKALGVVASVCESGHSEARAEAVADGD